MDLLDIRISEGNLKLGLITRKYSGIDFSLDNDGSNDEFGPEFSSSFESVK